MARYVYKMVPAPEKSARRKGLKGAELFAATLEEVLNTLGAEGWEYLRAETLPEEMRTGLTARKTVYRSVLIFRRTLPEDVPATPPPAATAQTATAQTATAQPLTAQTATTQTATAQPAGAPPVAGPLPPPLRRTETRPQAEGAPSLANLFLSRPDRSDPDRGDGT